MKIYSFNIIKKYFYSYHKNFFELIKYSSFSYNSMYPKNQIIDCFNIFFIIFYFNFIFDFILNVNNFKLN